MNIYESSKKNKLFVICIYFNLLNKNMQSWFYIMLILVRSSNVYRKINITTGVDIDLFFRGSLENVWFSIVQL